MNTRTIDPVGHRESDPIHLAQATPSPARPADYEASDVNRVLNQITGAFGDGAVWKGELRDAAQGIADLSPRERQSLVNNMASQPQGDSTLLDQFLGEVTSPLPLWWGGLNGQERTQLTQHLVPGQDGANLERIFHGLRRQQGDGVEDHQRAFSQQVANTATAEQRIDLVAQLADNAAAGDREAARAIAQQIGSLQAPDDSTEALSKLDRPTMDAVVAQSIDVDFMAVPSGDGHAVPVVLYDPALYTSMADAVALSHGASQKAAFIAASGPLMDASLRAEPGKAALTAVADGMSNVIGSDTNGVIGTTIEQTGFDATMGGFYASSGPQALRSYNSALIETDQGQKIRGILAQLRSGNDLQADAFTRFTTDERAAYVLGGYTGTVTSALDAIGSENGKRLATTAIFTATAIDTVKELSQFLPGKAIGIVTKFGAPIAKSAVALTALGLNADSVRNARDQSQLTILTAMPQGPSGSNAAEATEAREAFTSGLVLTERLAR